MLKLQRYAIHSYVYFFYTAMACFGPYLGEWLVSRHMSSQQIGLIYSIGPLCGLLIQPMWGMIIDRFGAQKGVLALCGILAPFLAFGYQYGTVIWIDLLTALGLAVFSNPIGPITDAMIVGHARRYNQSYGGIRFLGSLSFAIAATPIGLFYAHLGVDKMFLVYLAFMLLAVVFVIPLRVDPVRRGSLFKGMKDLLTNRSFSLFLLLTLFVAIGQQTYNTFYGVYITHLGGGVTERLGVLYTTAALAELPFFILSSRWIQRFGFAPVLAVGALTGCVRWFILAIHPSFGLLVANQLLNGITYALFYAAGVNFAYEKSPEHVRTTAQSVFSVIYLNVSNLIGANGGGWVISAYGFATVFDLTALSCLLGGVGFLVLALLQRAARRRPIISSGEITTVSESS